MVQLQETIKLSREATRIGSSNLDNFVDVCRSQVAVLQQTYPDFRLYSLQALLASPDYIETHMIDFNQKSYDTNIILEAWLSDGLDHKWTTFSFLENTYGLLFWDIREAEGIIPLSEAIRNIRAAGCQGDLYKIWLEKVSRFPGEAPKLWYFTQEYHDESVNQRQTYDLWISTERNSKYPGVIQIKASRSVEPIYNFGTCQGVYIPTEHLLDPQPIALAKPVEAAQKPDAQQKPEQQSEGPQEEEVEAEEENTPQEPKTQPKESSSSSEEEEDTLQRQEMEGSEDEDGFVHVGFRRLRH